MNQEKKDIKQQLRQKFLEFKQTGLKSYRKYLDEHLRTSEGVSHKKAYTKYIVREIKGNQKRLDKVAAKLDAE